MSLVLKKAEELADAIMRSEEYQRLTRARETVEQHESAKIMLRDFAKLQETLRRKQLMGQPLTDEDKANLQKMGELVGYNPYVRSLLEAEMAFAELMVQVQDIIGKVFDDGEESGAETKEEAGDGAEKPQPTAKSKLWIPGR